MFSPYIYTKSIHTTHFRTIETENHFLRIEMESKTNRFYIYRLGINVWGNYIELKQVYKYKIDSVSIPPVNSQKVILCFNLFQIYKFGVFCASL